MPKISLSLPHHLGKEEAIKRVHAAIEAERKARVNIVNNVTENWVGDDHVDFTMTIFSYAIEGTLDVKEESVDVVLSLPLVATMMTGMIENQLRQEISGFLA